MIQYSQEMKRKPNTAEQVAEAVNEKAACRKSLPVGYMFTSLLLVMAIALSIFISFQVRTKGYVDIGGFSLFRVVTGSMEPTIAAGELLLCRATEIENVAIGEIVCYQTESSQIGGAVVTHRVVEIGTDEKGHSYLVTQGDANLVADTNLVQKNDLIGRVVWYSGKESVLNDALAFLISEIGFLTCIVLPVFLAAGLILQSAVKNLYQEIAQFKSELNRSVENAEQKDENEDDKTVSNVLLGYTALTQADYDELLQKVKAELIEELKSDVVPEKGAASGSGSTE